jgi:hypothetical protein
LNGPSRDHHFVPRFYLRRWEDVTGRLWVFRRERGRELKPRPYPVAQVLYERDLYTVRGSQPDDVFKGEEMVFQEIDDDVAEALNAVVDGVAYLSADQRRALWRFMYTLQVRNPRTIRDLASEAPRMEREITEELARRLGPPAPGRPTFSDLLASEAEAGEFLATIIAKTDHRYRDFFNVSSAFVQFEPPITLFTSDYPFLAFPDIDSPGALFVFPVSPSLCHLAFAERRMEPLFLRHYSRVQLADFVNLIGVSRAEFLYSNSDVHELAIYDLPGSWSDDPATFRRARESVMVRGEPPF